MPALQVYHEILPDSYLLILAENDELPEEVPLAKLLRQAANSGKAYVWVDCSHIHRLSHQAIGLLRKYYLQLRRRHIPLVLCHLDESLQQLFRQLPAASQPPIVPTLLDADHYCHAGRSHRS
ncbi:STAS domain-containing protein [Hymenobacter algoricola]|uniref:STAS domain-containing protein n=1 Tax=Hymenobacter algoricola TaxID=486267 RepID=A0ABP7MET7_9BACT